MQEPGLHLLDILVVVAYLATIVWIGVYPKPFLGRLHASVAELVQTIERGSATAEAPGARLADAGERP